MGAASTTTAATVTDPRRTRRRRWLVAGGLVVLVLATLFLVWRLTGGGDLQRLSRAPDATVAAGTARTAVSGTVEGIALVGPFALTVAEGELDLLRQQAHLRRDVPAVSGVPLLGRLLPEPVEILHDGRDSYLRLPLGGQRAWVRLGTSDDPLSGPDSPAPGLTNPAAALGLLRALEGMPQALGEERVRDQPSTRFRVVVDLERAAAALSGRAEDLARGLSRLRGRNDLPLEVWLDDSDRVTRLRYVFEPQLGGRSDITVTTDLELWDFGVTVDIRAPAEDELVALPGDLVRDLDPLAVLREFLNRGSGGRE